MILDLFYTQSKKYLLKNILKILQQTFVRCDNKKDMQRIRLCHKILHRIFNDNYYDISERSNLDNYLYELNNKKKQKQRDIELFSLILGQYIMYGKE